MSLLLWITALLVCSGLSMAVQLAPKVFIVNFYDDEANVWYGIPDFDLLAQNISLPGLSPLFPYVHCTQDASICQAIVGEGEINAAVTMTALTLSSTFDLRKTYFILAGDGGISPHVATLGSVTFAYFAIQVALQYEMDARERPAGSSSGYVPQGATDASMYPVYIYGTEVFQLNDALRQRAISFAKTANLSDSAEAAAYRSLYELTPNSTAAIGRPSVVACDSATSDNWWTGNLLAAAFEDTVKLFTNGSATYCVTQQEDNSVLEALTRGALAERVDFGRVILMRTGSDFDRPPAGMSAADNLFYGTGGYDIAIQNLYLAGVKVIQGIVENWNSTFAAGIPVDNYIGDIFGSLGGTPPFGTAASHKAT